MCKPASHRSVFVCLLQVIALGMLIAPTPILAVTVPATWTGSGDGVSYNDPQNWDIATVPINDVTNQYVVNIPSGSVNYDVIDDPGTGHNEVLQFTLAAGATINLQGRNLVVTDSAAVGGRINAMSGSLKASHVSGSLTGSQMTISVDTSANPTETAEVTLGASGTYSSTSSAVKNSTILRANGPGATLNLGSLSTLDSYVNQNGANTRKITATSGGMIDLSGVTTIRGGNNEWLSFTATTGGTIDLSGLQQVEYGYARFIANNGGHLSFGDLSVTPLVHFDIDDANTEVSFGHLSLASNANFAASGGAVIQVAGDFSLEMTDETRFDMDSGIMQFCGEPMQWFEVAGTDNGVDGDTTDNFALAQLIVGSNTDATDVVLVDLFDNGNRNSDTEALYLLGSGGLDGLQILGGSTLHIGNIPVYALIGGQMTDLHSLFAPGETVIAYSEFGSDGFLSVPEPSTVMLLLLGFCSGILLRANRRSKHAV